MKNLNTKSNAFFISLKISFQDLFVIISYLF